MTRALTVAQMKRANGSRLLPDAPGEGTMARKYYDLFKSQPGIPIKMSWSMFLSRNPTAIKQRLINEYGLDIRCLKKGLWVLAGEWHGRVYIDYIAEQIKEPQQ